MKLEALFTTEVLLWRYVHALGCLLGLQVVPVGVCTLYRCVVYEGQLNPALVMLAVARFFSPARLIQWLVLAACLVMLARVHIKCYTVNAWVAVSRWEKCRRLVSPTLMVKVTLILASCVLLANLYSSLAHPDFIILMMCRPGQNLCNQRLSVVLYMGVCVGLHYAYNYFFNHGNLVTMAPVHPRKLQLIKAHLNLRNLKESCRLYGASKWSFLLAITLYMAFGIVHSVVHGGDWKEWLVVLDLPLMALTLLVTSLLAVTLNQFNQVFHVFITQPIQIPLAMEDESTGEGDSDSWKLCHALTTPGLLQVLAFWDLKTLSASDYPRRKEVFAISQPGGHPRNWLGIMNPSLNLIRKFTERLRRQNCPEDIPAVPPKPVDPTSAPTDLNKNQVAKPPSPTLRERLLQVLSGVKKYPVFAYFLSELPEAVNRSIFSEALPVIWAVQALGDLIAASFNEDKFGVVQRNIPDIIIAFIQLQKVVDSLGRGSMARRAGAGEALPSDVQLRRALRATLRSALYTITTTFGTTVLDLQVTPDCQAKLQSYLDFKEG